MKKLTLVLVLMFIPLVSYAQRGEHYDQHNYYQRGHNNSSFWHKVDRRQHKQESRIERGIDKGQLTRREVRKLHREQKHVAKQLRRYRHSHYLSRRDKRSVMEHLDYVSEKITDFKHNDRYARNYRHHDHQRDVHAQRVPVYQANESHVSWAGNGYSAGIHFRF
ncbi:MAG: hypothetical protein KAT04_07745 [Methylococcales bacterium]|nr:hypothetical protein [Methylococcales bacterium]